VGDANKFENNDDIQHLFAAMERYVIDLPRSIAIHLPVIRRRQLVDMEFIWGNKEFHSGRKQSINPSDRASKTRQRFEELLPALQEAWTEGVSVQYFTAGEGELEFETMWSRAEDVILEWGDDIGSKIKFGSIVESERHNRAMELVDAERDTFVQEIHDNVLQDLYVMTMDIGTVLANLDNMDSSQVQEAVWKQQLQLQKAQNDLRALITQEQGRSDPLADRLNSLPEFFSSDDLTVHVSVGPINLLGTLAQDAQNDLFYVVKESVSNAKKHSEGTLVNVTVTHEAETNLIVAQIADNGKGIDDLHTRSSGTKNMERRVTRQMGTLQLEHNPTGGLVVIAKVPASTDLSL
jgi:signal transduction histidine kinase